MSEKIRAKKRVRAWTLFRRPRVLFRFLTDARAPRFPQLVGILAVLYVLLPVDLIPDFVPVLGWLDDIGIASFAVAYVATQAARWETARLASAVPA